MKVEQLKAKVEAHREGLKQKSGSKVMFSETGPVGMSLIDAIVATLEAQEKRLDKMDRDAEEIARTIEQGLKGL